MKKTVKTFCFILVIGFMSLSLTTCDMLGDILGNGGDPNNGGGVFDPTSDQMATALKQALTTGSADAGATLSVKDAFWGNMARQIPLPTEAQNAKNSLNTLLNHPNISGIAGIIVRPLITTTIDRFDNLHKGINASAEEASQQVGPIFATAISSMSIYDAIGILKGDEGNEATEFLRSTTKDPLVIAFSPVLNAALDMPLVADYSALWVWNTIVTEYNSIANNALVSALGLLPPIVNTDLSGFILDKALTVVFNEMAIVEKEIRADPFKFVTNLFSDVSAKVFDWAKKAAGI